MFLSKCAEFAGINSNLIREIDIIDTCFHGMTFWCFLVSWKRISLVHLFINLFTFWKMIKMYLGYKIQFRCPKSRAFSPEQKSKFSNLLPVKVELEYLRIVAWGDLEPCRGRPSCEASFCRTLTGWCRCTWRTGARKAGPVGGRPRTRPCRRAPLSWWTSSSAIPSSRLNPFLLFLFAI